MGNQAKFHTSKQQKNEFMNWQFKRTEYRVCSPRPIILPEPSLLNQFIKEPIFQLKTNFTSQINSIQSNPPKKKIKKIKKTTKNQNFKN